MGWVRLPVVALLAAATACTFSKRLPPDPPSPDGGDERADGGDRRASDAGGDPSGDPGPGDAGGDPGSGDRCSSCGDPGLPCGNGVIDVPNEDCDGSNLNGEDCLSLGWDTGDLTCDPSSCLFVTADCACNARRSYCQGACIDTWNDREHCGGCDPCRIDQVCVASGCRDTTDAWRGAELQPRGTLAPEAAHDLATDGAEIWLASVTTSTGTVFVERFDPLMTNWQVAPTLMHGLVSLSPVIAVQADATQRHVALIGQQGADPLAVHLYSIAGLPAWDPKGWIRPDACDLPEALDMHAGNAVHVVVSGTGICRLQYMVWDGTWTGFPAMPGDSGGFGAVTFTTQSYIGGSAAISSKPGWRISHSVLEWDTGGNRWQPLGTDLDVHDVDGPRLEEHLDLTSDEGGNLYAAWAEWNGSQLEINVQTYPHGGSAWERVGSSPASGSLAANYPSITVIGDRLWLAFVSESLPKQVHVVTYDPGDGLWHQVGAPLNEASTRDAHAPVVVGLHGAPYVAFREGPETSDQDLYVKTFP